MGRACLDGGTLVEHFCDGAVAVEASEVGRGAALQVWQAVHNAMLKQQLHHLESDSHAAQPKI